MTVHDGGTYVNMDGPAFSTRAESELNRRHGFDVIGMTNLPEAKLAREAEIPLATMAMITDYDCWKEEEEPVSAQTVFGHLTANAETAKKVLIEAIPQVPMKPDWPEHFAWNEDGTQIFGKTPCGRATVIALQLNNLIAVMVRRAWVAADWHPPRDR